MMRTVQRRQVKYSIKWLLDVLDLGKPILSFLEPLFGKKWILRGGAEYTRSGNDLDNLLLPSEYSKVDKYDIAHIIETPRTLYKKREALWELRRDLQFSFHKWIISLLIDHEDIHYNLIKTLIGVAMTRGNLNSP